MSLQKRTRSQQVTWVVRWRESGRGSRQNSRSFATRAEAKAFEAEVERMARMGAHGSAEPSTQTLEAWLAQWWAKNQTEWSANTRRVRRSLVERWIVPQIGDVRLRQLGTARVRDWRAEILSAGASPTQASHALSVLSSALGKAVDDGLLPANPCAKVRKVGRSAPVRPRALVPTELEAVRAELPTQADVVAWGLMAYAGLRPSEALAVRWEDLEGVILVVDAMKTLRRRAVEIIAPLADDLEDLRAVDALAGDLVVTSPHGLPVNLNNWRRRVFLPACQRAGIDADPNDGRTSCISLLVHEGRSLAYVAAAVGNSARVISDHYLHVLRAAELGNRRSMADAIYAARRDLGVRPVCVADTVIDLSEARRTRKSV